MTLSYYVTGPGGSSDPSYYKNDIANCDHVLYAFLCLDRTPDPDQPHIKYWNGLAIYETMTDAPIIAGMPVKEYDRRTIEKKLNFFCKVSRKNKNEKQGSKISIISDIFPWNVLLLRLGKDSFCWEIARFVVVQFI